MDSGSTRKATLTRKSPTVIQSKSVGWARRSAAGFDTRSTNTPIATPKATATVAVPSHPAEEPRHRLPVSSRTTAPASGRAGIKGARFTWSSLQQVGVVHVGAPAFAIQGHDDGQAHDHLGRRHHHRE